MRETRDGNMQNFIITSEPGDATRYDYYVLRDAGMFFFIPRKQSFPMPNFLHSQSLPKTDEEINNVASRFNCNFWSVKECVRTVKDLTGQILTYNVVLDVPEEKERGEDDFYFVSCPSCSNGEGISVDEQRHHIKGFRIMRWKGEKALMTCIHCGEMFWLDFENGEYDE